MPKQKETVELQVGGQIFKAWEQITATAEFGSFREFAFLATEAISSSGGQSSPNWSTLQIKPGDECSIKFAGQPFLEGVVNCRTANYNAFMHNVLLSGKSFAAAVNDMSASMKDNNGGQFSGQTWEAIARKMLEKTDPKITLVMQGSTELSEQPFDDAQINPGETIFNCLGRLARHRGITLFDNHKGEMIALADTVSSSGGSLVEGKNIQSATARIEDTTIFPTQINLGQTNGTDTYWGRRAAQGAAHSINPNVKGYKPYLLLGDRRMTTKEAVGRLDYENIWTPNDNMAVDIVVYGWQSDDGSLWEVGDSVTVNSPMLMLRNNKLYIKRVDFTQDNEQGSLAHLHLVGRLSTKDINLDVPQGSPQPAKPGTG
jgi:prophage tail gpP-like protein